MQSRMIVTAVLLSFFIITVETNAEMRISPDGVTFPDNSTQITAVSGGGISAPLHLSGSFSTGDPTEGPVGATISGVNTNSDVYPAYGGYFETMGANGRAVYGSATNSGNTVNFGGYFSGPGTFGTGVCGFAIGSAGNGVYGYGNQYDFYAAGPGSNYGPFTGAHEVKFAQDMPEVIVPGMISSVTGRTAERKDKSGVISLSSTTNEIVSLSGPGAASNMLQFKAGGHVLGFQPNKAYLAGLDHALSIEFLGTPGVMPTAASSAATTGNMTSAPTLSTVLYQNLWEGISLTYESTKDGITESTYQIAPGGDISKIRLRYNVPVELQADGSLRFKFDKGYLIESSPVAWQEIGGKRVPVTVAFRLSDGEVGFRMDRYDPSYPLIIDPIYIWNSFFGPSSGDD